MRLATPLSKATTPARWRRCEKAIARLPNDAVLHEFRGLALFALQRYQEAAGPVYAVLSVGPGWDWTTLSGFYPDIDVYTEQLRGLEHYVNANPNAAEVRFLLAYHYLTCGHTDAAATQLKAAVELNPNDHLSAQLLGALTTTTPPEQPAPSAPAKPVDASSLVGDWKASRADGAAIALNLAKDGQYTWKFAQKGKPQEFSGAYTVADNLLILKQGNNPVMVGQVTLVGRQPLQLQAAGRQPQRSGADVWQVAGLEVSSGVGPACRAGPCRMALGLEGAQSPARQAGPTARFRAAGRGRTPSLFLSACVTPVQRPSAFGVRRFISLFLGLIDWPLS